MHPRPHDGASETFTLDHLTKAIAERLPLVPLFRRRLVEVPLGLDKAYWIDDPDFDIEFHVRELALPKPGNDRQLSEQVARLHARPLDRSRPLWELYLISGLPRGKVAIYNKIHHAAVDGVSGGDILSALLDLTPEGRPVPEEPEPYVGEQPPSGWSLLARSAQSALTANPASAFNVAIGPDPLVAGHRRRGEGPARAAAGPAGGDARRRRSCSRREVAGAAHPVQRQRSPRIVAGPSPTFRSRRSSRSAPSPA